MRTSLKLAAVLATVWGGGCLPRDNTARPDAPLFSAKDLAEFMGTREEREARAPYSPPGWPFRVGDTISREGWYEGETGSGGLVLSFLGYLCDWGGIDIAAPFWVGDMVFGAEFETVPASNAVLVGSVPGSPDMLIAEVPGGGELVEHPRGGDYVYEGHFRRYIGPGQAGTCQGSLPPHVRDHGFGVLVVPESDRDPPGTWTRERWLEGYVGGGR